VPTAGTPQPFGFTGELHRAGQVYLRARWYAPGQGRFVSEDPFAGFAERPYSLHAYQYGYSNPLRWTDPTGENPLGVGGVSAACLAFIAGDGPFPFGDAVCVALLIALGLGVTTLPLTSTNRTLVGPDVPTTCDPFETFIDSLPQTALDPSPEHQPKPTIVPPAPVPVPAPTPDDEEDECEQSTYHYGALETFDSADPKRKRATGARARLCIPLGKGTKFQKGRNGTHIEGFISGVHDRAHLIARELGGRGIQANGIPVFPSSNQYGSRWRQIEEMVKRAVDNGDTVVYKVTPIYNDSNGPNSVPISISVVASGRTIAINEVVPNIP
jgi:RHS repeat-associated protein